MPGLLPLRTERLVRLDAEGDGLNPAAVLRETGELVGDAALFYKGEWCDELDYALLADEWRAQRADRAAAGTISS